jgi:hypothetical protein
MATEMNGAEPAAVAAARKVLANPALHDALTLQLAAGLVELEQRARDFEDEADRAGAEVARRGERLRALGEEVERTEWDGPGVRPATKLDG